MNDSPFLNQKIGLSREELLEITNDHLVAQQIAREGTIVIVAVVIFFLALLVLLIRQISRGHWWFTVVAVVLMIFASYAMPIYIGKQLNGLNPVRSMVPLPLVVSDEAKTIFADAFVADFHADSLLWPRSLLTTDPSGPRGHVDIPRMIEGNVALQGFTIVSRVPSPMSFESNAEPTPLKDPVLLLGLLQGWGLKDLDVTSLSPRVLHQCAKLHTFAQESKGQLQVVRFKEDLIAYHAKRKSFRAQHPNSLIPFTAGYLGIEGLQALDGKLSNVDVFFDAGVRTMGLSHFYDTPVAGSQHGVAKGGLTDLGRAVVKRMNELHIFVDLAHASSQTIADVCDLYQQQQHPQHPLIVSHAGVSALCDNNRNLNDEQLKCIGRTGGIVAIAFFRPAICGHDEIKAIVSAIKYVRDLIGVEHVGLGSDFDGSVTVPFDVSKLVYIADGLVKEGFSREEIELVLGGNQLKLFTQYLPSSAAPSSRTAKQ